MAETVSITLRLFAVFRETVGSSTLEQEVPVGTTVGQVLEQLISEYPSLAGAEAAVSFSVNRAYASAETVLHAGDEVAFIPPVSGGTLLSIGNTCTPGQKRDFPPLSENSVVCVRSEAKRLPLPGRPLHNPCRGEKVPSPGGRGLEPGPYSIRG